LRLLAIAALALLAATGALAAPAKDSNQFDYFLLSLSWSPQYCAEHGGGPSTAHECAAGRMKGFVAHGLWPEDEDGSHRQSCRTAAPVPLALADRLRPIMPSRRLIQHEWAVHGTCSGLSQDRYFDTLARAFRKVQVPPVLAAAAQPVTLSLPGLKRLFAEANPGLDEGMIRVICSGGNQVAEIRICLDKDLVFRRCGGGQSDHCRAGQAVFRPKE
jgi:ribonuclease T2